MTHATLHTFHEMHWVVCWVTEHHVSISLLASRTTFAACHSPSDKLPWAIDACRQVMQPQAWAAKRVLRKTCGRALEGLAEMGAAKLPVALQLCRRPGLPGISTGADYTLCISGCCMLMV